MRITYHPSVQKDISEAIKFYRGISEDLAVDFWHELLEAFESSRLNPKSSHFADCGLRRKNLARFPYHFLYEIFEERIRVIVVRHHKRSSSFGLKRLKQ